MMDLTPSWQRRPAFGTPELRQHQQHAHMSKDEEKSAVRRRLEVLLRGASLVGDVDEMDRYITLLWTSGNPTALDPARERRHVVATFPVDEFGQSLLHCTSLFGRAEAVSVLLDHGADVNACTNGRRTPLMYAACRGHRQVAEILLSRGANVDMKDAHGTTAIEWAAVNGFPEVADLISTHAIDPYPESLRECATRGAAARRAYNSEQAAMFSQQISHELTHDELEHAHFKVNGSTTVLPTSKHASGPPPLRGFFPDGAPHDDAENSRCQ